MTKISYHPEVVLLRTIYNEGKMDSDELILKLRDLCFALNDRNIDVGFDFRSINDPTHSYVLDNAICEVKAEGYLIQADFNSYVLTEKGNKKMKEIENHLRPIDEEFKKLFAS
ncbi:MAG: hypothetical protein KJ906_02265 [Nanoarchaeota archaeon]|nr:hypothetical protein [Nanoarchaeota archaeon]